MALGSLNNYLNLLPELKSHSGKYMWLSYDEEADVLYINFKKPSNASDSQMTDDDLIYRYDGQEIIGITVLNASTRRLTS